MLKITQKPFENVNSLAWFLFVCFIVFFSLIFLTTHKSGERRWCTVRGCPYCCHEPKRPMYEDSLFFFSAEVVSCSLLQVPPRLHLPSLSHRDLHYCLLLLDPQDSAFIPSERQEDNTLSQDTWWFTSVSSPSCLADPHFVHHLAIRFHASLTARFLWFPNAYCQCAAKWKWKYARSQSNAFK